MSTYIESLAILNYELAILIKQFLFFFWFFCKVVAYFWGLQEFKNWFWRGWSPPHVPPSHRKEAHTWHLDVH